MQLLGIVILIVFSPAPAHAYLDLGTGSIILQGLLGGIAFVGLMAKVYWNKLMGLFVRRKTEVTLLEEEADAERGGTTNRGENENEDIEFHPASFRDPHGFLFSQNAVLYRQVNHSFIKQFDEFIDSGLYDELVKREYIVRHRDVTKVSKRQQAMDTGYSPRVSWLYFLSIRVEFRTITGRCDIDPKGPDVRSEPRLYP